MADKKAETPPTAPGLPEHDEPTEEPKARQATPEEQAAARESAEISNWEFIDVVPTRDDVVRLLSTLPEIWGVPAVAVADYVQALPQTKKVKVPNGPNSNQKREVYMDTFSLYVSVAGRLAMVRLAAEANTWAVDFEPEPGCEIPGFIDLGRDSGRIVYREYMVVKQVYTDGRMIELGRKPGMAWVPSTGGKQAAGSNPYEKVETAARGRAIAAWGFGVLPGSGVASVEEVMGAAYNERAAQRMATQQPQQGQPPAAARQTRAQMLQRIHHAAEAVRAGRDMTAEGIRDQIGQYLVNSLGIGGAVADDGEVVWANVNDGALQLLANSLEEGVASLTSKPQAF